MLLLNRAPSKGLGKRLLRLLSLSVSLVSLNHLKIKLPAQPENTFNMGDK